MQTHSSISQSETTTQAPTVSTKGQTMKTFISQSNLPESLIRGVIRQVGGWDSFRELASDVTNHGASGGFIGFYYYSDTVSFAKRHKAVILDYAKQMADDLGEAGAMSLIASFNCLKMNADEVAEALYNQRSDESTNVYNALAWFALEEVSRSFDDMVQA